MLNGVPVTPKVCVLLARSFGYVLNGVPVTIAPKVCVLALSV